MKALVFDTETTGLINNRSVADNHLPSVIEYYGCYLDLKTGKVINELELLIKPQEYPMTDKTMKDSKTQLSNELLKDAPMFANVAEQIQRQIEGSAIVIAHNIAFDQEMLNIEFERIRKRIRWGRVICSVEETAYLKGMRLTLSNLHQFLFKEPFADAHRAKADGQALVRCCVSLYKKGLLA